MQMEKNAKQINRSGFHDIYKVKGNLKKALSIYTHLQKCKYREFTTR